MLVAAVVAAEPPPAIRQATGPAAPSADAAAEINSVVQRYARAWYEANATAMAEVLHPEFSRRLVRRGAGRPDAVEVASGLALLDQVDRGAGVRAGPAERKAAATVLNISGGTASVLLVLTDRTETLELVRWNNRWRVLSSLAEGAQQ